MKFVYLSFLFLIILSFFVLAIPYPGDTECGLYDGTLDVSNQTLCILPNASVCSVMEQYESIPLCSDILSMPCAAEGKTKTLNECCDSLTPIRKKEHFDSACVAQSYTGYYFVCANCGDGVCDGSIESVCNCPKDCNAGPIMKKVGFFRRAISWFGGLFR